jgi:hypothetical protein
MISSTRLSIQTPVIRQAGALCQLLPRLFHHHQMTTLMQRGRLDAFAGLFGHVLQPSQTPIVQQGHVAQQQQAQPQAEVGEAEAMNSDQLKFQQHHPCHSPKSLRVPVLGISGWVNKP